MTGTGNASGPAEFKQDVFIQVLCLNHFHLAEFDVERIGVLKVIDLHSVNDLSKKAFLRPINFLRYPFYFVSGRDTRNARIGSTSVKPMREKGSTESAISAEIGFVRPSVN
jgi:hypothetical protein